MIGNLSYGAGLPVEAAEGPLVIAALALLRLLALLALLGLLVLLDLVVGLGLGILLVKGDGQLLLLLVPDDGQRGLVPGLIVAGQGGGEGGGGRWSPERPYRACR